MNDITSETREFRSYMRLSNFSKSTVDMYTRTLSIFLQFCNDNYPDEDLNQDYAQQYLLQRIDSGKAWSTINADYSALRKYYKIFKEYPWSLKKLPRHKKDKKLPAILSKEEVAKLIRGKGAKDHTVVLNEKLLLLLREYFKIYKPHTFLFNGKLKATPYSPSAGQWAIRRGRSIANISRKCSIHTLRNCYATHHLELGTDLVFLQEQMGHKNLKTTAKYIRLCVERYRQINHPIDKIHINYRKLITWAKLPEILEKNT